MNNINLITAALTGFASIMHFYRILINGQMIIGSWEVPMIVSWIAFLIAGYISINFWRNLK